MDSIPHTVFEYLYRDAGNYKAGGQLLLIGEYTTTSEDAIRKSCDSWDHFVAEQVGVPALYSELYQYSDGPTEDDVAFHEFERLRPATSEDLIALPRSGTLDALISRFQAVKYWDCLLSPHCC